MFLFWWKWTSFFSYQRRVFSDLGQGVLDNAWQGYNAALFAYGQTGSGKSYSMIGYGPNKGIVPITCEELFKAIEDNKDESKQLQVHILQYTFPTCMHNIPQDTGTLYSKVTVKLHFIWKSTSKGGSRFFKSGGGGVAASHDYFCPPFGQEGLGAALKWPVMSLWG